MLFIACQQYIISWTDNWYPIARSGRLKLTIHNENRNCSSTTTTSTRPNIQHFSSMVSSRSLQPFIWATLATYRFGIFPAVWNATECQFALTYERSVHMTITRLERSWSWFVVKIAPALYFTLQALIIAHLLWVLVFVSLPDLDYFMNLFLSICFLMSFVSQLQFLLHFEDFIGFINTFLKLDLQMRK